ncbi:hypothetical protein Aperf_G00000018468 [Anoplocephala perfoliata]
MGGIISFTQASRKLKRKSDEDSSDRGSTPAVKRIRATYEHVYKQMFIKGEGSDITVIALNREWRLHRVYLKHSPYFSALLEGGWKESDYGVLKLNLIDRNITEEGLHVTFGSFYNDSVQITRDNVIGVLAAATWFHLDEIRDCCERILCRYMRLRTITSLYELSIEYHLPKLENACISWLSTRFAILPRTKLSFEVMKRIPISLMQSVVQQPSLIVVKFEQDLFLSLLEWIYLRLHPELPFRSGPEFLSDVYRYFREESKDFFETAEGKPYAPVLKAIRWNHVLTSLDATRDLISDHIVPEAWLNEAYRSLWLKELESHEFYIKQRRDSQTNIINTTSNLAHITSIRRIPGSSPSHPTPPTNTATEASETFWQCCERYSRIIEDPRGSHGWRWTGYCFGVDLMFQFRRKSFYVIRLTDTSGAVGLVSTLPTIKVELVLKVLSIDSAFENDRATDIVSDSLQEMLKECKEDFNNDDDNIDDIDRFTQPKIYTSGYKTFQMIPNANYELLRLPGNVRFPIVVSAYILR